MGKLPPAPGEWELGPSLPAEIDKMKGKLAAAETTGAMETGEKRGEMKMRNSGC